MTQALDILIKQAIEEDEPFDLPENTTLKDVVKTLMALYYPSPITEPTQKGFDIVRIDDVDNIYGCLGYDLELYTLVEDELGSTSALAELIFDIEHQQ